jgi:hypothetical protein
VIEAYARASEKIALNFDATDQPVHHHQEVASWAAIAGCHSTFL